MHEAATIGAVIESACWNRDDATGPKGSYFRLNNFFLTTVRKLVQTTL